MLQKTFTSFIMEIYSLLNPAVLLMLVQVEIVVLLVIVVVFIVFRNPNMITSSECTFTFTYCGYVYQTAFAGNVCINKGV